MQIGPYRVLGELGSGGMGAVYRAQRPDGLQVALKVLHPGTLDAELVERFRREASLLRGIEHPHLVRVLDVSVAPPLPYAAFELVEGGTLEAKVLREGPCDWRNAIQIVAQISAGVAAAHERGLLHRDIKPANVLLGEAGAKLADFGLVKDLNRDSLTQSGTTLGTPGYLAPEQIGSDKDRWGPSTDVYGLAATLYFALTGRPPFRGGSTLATLEQVVNEPAPAPRKLNPGVPPWLEALCLRGLAKLNRDRYRDALTFRAALLHGAPAPAATKGRALRWIGVAAVVACVGLGAALALSRSRTRDDVEPGVATTQGGQDPRTDEAELDPAEPSRDQQAEAVAKVVQSTGEQIAQVGKSLAAPEALAALREANRALEEGKLPLALRFFDKALEHDASAPQAHLGRGWAHYRAGRFRAAESDFSRAIELGPDVPLAYFRLGISLQRQARYEESLQPLTRAIELDQETGLHWGARALSLECLSLFAAAQRDLKEVLRHDPDEGVQTWVVDHQALCTKLAQISPKPASVNTLIQQSARALKDKRHAKAAQLATEALARHPELVVPHLMRAEARWLQGITQQALDDLNSAIDLAPGDVKALLTLAKTHQQLGQPEQALKNYERALEFEPGNQEALALRGEVRGEVRVLNRDREGALADFKTALEHNPDNLNVLRRRGLLLQRMGEAALALSDFERVLRLEPGNQQARTGKGRALLHLGRVSEALEVLDQDGLPPALRDLDRVLKKNPNDAQAHQTRGLTRCKAGQFRRAEEDFVRAIALEPGVPLTHHGLGAALQLQGRYEESLQPLSRAIELEPGNMKFHAVRALSFQCLSRPSEALEDFDRVLRGGGGPKVRAWLTRQQKLCEQLAQAVPPPDRVDTLLAKCIEALNTGRNDAAVRLATAALQRHPQLVEALVVRAHARWALKDNDAAFKDWANALEHAPGEVKILLARAEARRQLGLPKPALEDCNRAVGFEPQNAEVYVLRAKVRVQQEQAPRAKQLELSVADLGLALQQDPEHSEARALRGEFRGVMRFRAGDLDGARADFSDALKHAPDNLNVLRHRGLLLLALNAPVRALADFEQILARHPQNLAAGAGKAQALILLDRQDEALDVLKQGAATDQHDVGAYRSRGWSFLKLGEGMLALRNFDRVLKHAVAPLAADYSGRGQALLLLRKLKEAVAEFDRALTLTQDPNERSDLQAQRAAALAEDTSPGAAEVVVSQARDALEDKEVGRARELFNRAIKADPGYARAYTERGWFHFKMGRLRDAEHDFVRSIRLAPKVSSAHQGMAMTLQRQARYVESLTHFARAIELAPDNPLAYATRSVSFQCLARFDEARADHKTALQHKPGEYLRSWISDHAKRCEQLAKPNASASIKSWTLQSQRALRASDYTLASELAAKALLWDPDLLYAHHLLGSARWAQGQTAQAMKSFDEAAALGPGNSAVLLMRAQAFREIRKPELAEKDCTDALVFEPNNTQVLLLLARVRSDLGRLEPALACVRRTLKVDPRNREALALEGELDGILHSQEGRLEEAVAAFDRALALTQDPAARSKLEALRKAALAGRER